jgi:hypothetical protein
MTKSEQRKAFFVVLVIAVLAAAVATNEDARQLARQDRLSRGDYYDRLEASCGGSGCCEASVTQMRQTRAKLQPTGGCEAGETADMLRCHESYRWCEPAK